MSALTDAQRERIWAALGAPPLCDHCDAVPVIYDGRTGEATCYAHRRQPGLFHRLLFKLLA
jgi:hypothetical protein